MGMWPAWCFGNVGNVCNSNRIASNGSVWPIICNPLQKMYIILSQPYWIKENDWSKKEQLSKYQPVFSF